MKNYLNKHHCNHRSECRLDPVIAVQGRPRRNRKSLSCFMNGVISQLELLGKERTCEAYRAARNSFLSFTGRDVLLSDIDSDLMMLYEAHLRRRGVTANTSSFYMRILRAVCNRAAEQGLMGACTAFRHVYTGVDKTVKRAVSLDTVRSLKELPLRRGSSGELARDMFLFSFYTRGMSFVDMAYLRKSDLHDTEFSYTRRKTGQRLSVRWEQCMQEVVDKYNTYDSPYLLPLIRYEGKDERRQYINALRRINRQLLRLGQMVDAPVPLTMYVARHTWASVARGKHIPLSVISEGMGHDSENTTRIYLAALDNREIDRANRMVLDSL